MVHPAPFAGLRARRRKFGTVPAHRQPAQRTLDVVGTYPLTFVEWLQILRHYLSFMRLLEALVNTTIA